MLRLLVNRCPCVLLFTLDGKHVLVNVDRDLLLGYTRKLGLDSQALLVLGHVAGHGGGANDLSRGPVHGVHLLQHGVHLAKNVVGKAHVLS